MMEYFLLRQLAENPVRPVLPEPGNYPYRLTHQNFEGMPTGSVAYFRYGDEEQMPGILLQPTFMVNDTIRSVMELYDGTIRFKTLALLPDVIDRMTDSSVNYSIPDIKCYECLHEDCVVMPDGTVKRLVVDHRKIPNADVFSIKETTHNRVLVSLRMAESISRRNVYGVEFERVEVR